MRAYYLTLRIQLESSTTFRKYLGLFVTLTEGVFTCSNALRWNTVSDAPRRSTEERYLNLTLHKLVGWANAATYFGH